VSRYWVGRAVDWMRAHPLDWARLTARKALLVWHADEIMDTDSFEAYADHSSLLALLGRVLHFGTLLPLAGVGAWATRRAFRRLAILHAALAALTAGIAAFYVMGRYRHPLLPILALFAAAGIVALVEAVRRRDARGLATAAAIALPLGLLANRPAPADADPRAVTYYSIGAGLAEAGTRDAARAYLERALALAPDLPGVRFELGDLALIDGDLSRAERWFEEALRVDPRDADARCGLGMLRARQGDAAGAAASYAAALELDPDHAAAHNNLAILLAGAGRLDDAVAHLEHALRAEPERADLAANLGRIHLARGDPARAGEAFERALRLDPQHTAAREGLARLAGRGRGRSL
jgi:Tfp pilus assembly protein PilF